MVAPISREQYPDVHAVGTAFEPIEKSVDAVEATVAIDDEPAMLGAQIFPRAVHGDFSSTAKRHEIVLAFGVALGLPRFDGSVPERPARVGDDEVEVDPDSASKTLARLARS